MAHIGDAFRNSCILTGVGVVAIVINTFVISRFGRRRVFLMVGMFLCKIHCLSKGMNNVTDSDQAALLN